MKTPEFLIPIFEMVESLVHEKGTLDENLKKNLDDINNMIVMDLNKMYDSAIALCSSMERNNLIAKKGELIALIDAAFAEFVEKYE